MAVRMDDDRGAGSAPSGRGGPLPMVLLAATCLVLVITLITTLMNRDNTTPGTQPPPPAITAGTTPAGSTSPANPAPTADYSWPSEPVLEQVAPGLDRCQTTTAGLNAAAMNGIGYEWEATQQGGIAAALNYLQFRFGPTFLNKQSFTAIADKTVSPYYGLPEELEADRKEYQKTASLNEDGEIVDAKTGKVNQGQAWLSGAYPRYGAYRLLSYTTAAGKPDDLFVSIWLPLISGPASAENVSAVKATWVQVTLMMVWEDGDWKASIFRYAPDSPTPADPSFVNQSFQERVEALGPGWCVTADASEVVLPGVVKGR